MAFKIYTKTGDNGSTSLLGGTKVAKSDIRIEAYGTIDELNSYVGLVSDVFQHPFTQNILHEIQDRLFTIGALLACDPEKTTSVKLPALTEDDVVLLENAIDKMNEDLPAMKSFVLPGGHMAVSSTHVARCVCRRAERCCVQMQVNQLQVDALIIKYLNRLSDYLFVLSRFISHTLQVNEKPWRPRVAD